MHVFQLFEFGKKYHPLTDFNIGKSIGSGSFSVVHECYRRADSEKFAIKIIKKRCMKEMFLLENEVKIMMSLTHPNIIKLIDVYETDEELFLVMEYVSGGELYNYLIDEGPFDEGKSREIFRQVIEAVRYLHSNGIAHRDIKLENILWIESSFVLKLTDFGLSKNIRLSDVEFMRSPVGTPRYVAPEIIKGENYTSSVDIWALGVVLYLLLFCKYPFTGDSLAEIYEQIETGQVNFPSEIEISDDVRDLVCNLLTEDLSKRYTLEQIVQHPWIQK